MDKPIRKSILSVVAFLLAMLTLLTACEMSGAGDPTEAPTTEPTVAPTDKPTEAPTAAPTDTSTTAPTDAPTAVPTDAPTAAPTEEPTETSTAAPTDAPTQEPTQFPTSVPTVEPTEEPTETHTELPTAEPTVEPTQAPTEVPTQAPTEKPTEAPTAAPTDAPTEAPTEEPTEPPYSITVEGEGTVYANSDGSYELEDPKKQGYRFTGWVDESGEPFASSGVIDKDVTVSATFVKVTEQGMTFSTDIRLLTDRPLSAFPVTVGFKLKITEKLAAGEAYGTMLSNSIRWDKHLQFEINKDRHPTINLACLAGDPDGLLYYSTKSYVFDDVTVPVGEVVDLFYVIDIANSKIHCYYNGKQAQTVYVASKFLGDGCYNKNPFVIGGNTTGSNYNCFKGEIYSISAWSDTRSYNELKARDFGTTAAVDSALLVKYEFYERTEDELLLDMSGNGYNIGSEKLWLDKSEVEDATGDYTFAIIGDTQSLVKKHRYAMTELYDWIVENKEEHNIQYVMGLGDVTENVTTVADEFEFARENIYKLSGVVPFSISVGNHDKYDFKDPEYNYIPSDRRDFMFNKTFYNETYLNELDGWYGEGDVTCSYSAFRAGNTDWLLVNLDFGPTDEMLEWASGVIEDHPDHKVIVITHAYMYRDGTTIDREDCYAPSRYNSVFNDGDQVFDKLISQHENIVLAIGGHDPHDHIVCTQVKGVHGNTVTQMLIDPQYMDYYYGATGMVALLHFSEADNTMTVRYYSTAKDMYGSEQSQFTVKLD